MKTWQRRIKEVPALEDLTTLEKGSTFIWESREVVTCPACSRSGIKCTTQTTVGPAAIVAHIVDQGRNYLDYCIEADFLPGSPNMITLDVDGVVKDEFYATTAKAEVDAGKN